MIDKERFTTTLDGELLRRIKILAINERVQTNQLLEEAIVLLLEKYERLNASRKPSAKETLPARAILEDSSKYKTVD